MPIPPKRPPAPRAKKTDLAVEQVAGRAIVARAPDPRQAGLFDKPLPGWIKPCLPTLVDKPPVGPQWVHEIKWDGYRVSAYVEAGAVTIRTRNGHDWTKRFPAIAAGVAALKVRSAVIDGEAVVLDDKGRSNFAELQILQRINARVNAEIEPASNEDHWNTKLDHWDYPTDGKGDCKIYALWKRKLLIDLGVPRQSVLMTIVRDHEDNGHTVLTVKTDRGDFILDNMVSEIRAWDATGYKFVKRQSQRDPNVWVSIGRNATAAKAAMTISDASSNPKKP